MSTTTAESTSETRSAGRQKQAQDQSVRQLNTSMQSTELAVLELIDGSANAVRAFLPRAMVRPTEAVTTVFDLAEQALLVGRRVGLEIATMVETGIAGPGNRAA